MPRKKTARPAAGAPRGHAASARRRWIRYDFPDFLVGTAEYPDGPTGCTVLHFRGDALGAVDVRGGAVAARETTALEPLGAFGTLDALFVAGGSTYGLAVGDGIMQELRRQRRGDVGWDAIPAVPGAVVYDFVGRADRRAIPYARLGVRALRAARANQVSVGAVGAGANLTVGSYWGEDCAEPGGQGAAFLETRGLKLFALAVVNAAGNVLGSDGTIVAGSRDPATGERFPVTDLILEHAASRPGPVPRGNTTVSIVVVNARLDRTVLQRIAVMAHAALGRVIEPFQTPYDGDLLFVVSTSTATLDDWEPADVGVLAGRLLQQAVLEAVR
jgi:L-aminopeptidase/D-esterase-like protein